MQAAVFASFAVSRIKDRSDVHDCSRNGSHSNNKLASLRRGCHTSDSALTAYAACSAATQPDVHAFANAELGNTMPFHCDGPSSSQCSFWGKFYSHKAFIMSSNARMHEVYRANTSTLLHSNIARPLSFVSATFASLHTVIADLLKSTHGVADLQCFSQSKHTSCAL